MPPRQRRPPRGASPSPNTEAQSGEAQSGEIPVDGRGPGAPRAPLRWRTAALRAAWLAYVAASCLWAARGPPPGEADFSRGPPAMRVLLAPAR